jgi:hypothetical protein
LAIRLSPPEVQKMSDILYEIIGHARTGMAAQIKMMREVLQIKQEDVVWPLNSMANENVFYGVIKGANGKDKLKDIILYCFNRSYNDIEDEERFRAVRNILNAHGHTIETDSGDWKVIPTSSKIVRKVKQFDSDWLAENAPKDSISYLKKAKSAISRSDWPDALHNCRVSLEGLASHPSFNEALDELVSKNIILVGDSRRKSDKELLSAIYGFASTFGSHPGKEANLRRAKSLSQK